MKSKDTLRQHHRKQRALLSESEVHQRSKVIGDRLFDLVDFTAIRTVHIYSSNRRLREVATEKITASLIDSFAGIYLTRGTYSARPDMPAASYDLIIVPVVSFDTGCNRIGLGGGWYDRFLKTQRHALKVGLAFDAQKSNQVPIEAHDVQLDVVITETHTYRNTEPGGRLGIE